MATAYKTALDTAGQKAWTSRAGLSVTVYAEITAATAGLNDTFAMIPIPAGARVVNWILGADQLDSNGSPTITISLGDSGSATRYANALTTIGRATTSAPITALTIAGFGYVYTADDNITVKISAAAATYASGKIRLYVEYMPSWY